ncbi:MAG: T9SS C-terminal target domain-containing protein [Chitinophagaceae bacterium]|nr:MAG: T9SS C-terminal target domain-containing protein [Chitinophagaceae bacterium]
MPAITRFLFIFILFTFSFNVLQASSEEFVYHKFWIQFTDKADSPYSLDFPDEFLSERAINRRLNQNISLTEDDLPINPHYIDSILTFGVPILTRSKWFNAVTIETTDSTILSQIENLSFVNKIEGVARYKLEVDTTNGGESLADFESNDNSTSLNGQIYGNGFHQLKMLRGDFLHELGYRGRDMIIGVMDAGFRDVNVIGAFDSLWLQGRILHYQDFVNPGTDVFDAHTHGTHVLSVMGSNLPGQMMGTAPDASYMLFRTEDGSSEYRIEEDNWVAAAEFADSAGADILNTSLGYTRFDDAQMNYSYQDMTGAVARISIAADLAAKRGMVVVNSAGNSGNSSWRYISAPADGRFVIAVGAMDDKEVRAGFSSVGPSYDGRVKPDIMAMGRGTAIVSLNNQLRTANGTSFSAPVVSGLIAALWQTNPDKSAKEVRDALLKSANRYYNPDSLYGYGIPDFHKAYLLLNDQPLPTVFQEEKLPLAYPNPFQNQLNIMYFSEKTEIIKIDVFDTFGNKVLYKEAKVYKDRFNRIKFSEIGSLPAAMYIVRIKTSQKQISLKVIKN